MRVLRTVRTRLSPRHIVALLLLCRTRVPAVTTQGDPAREQANDGPADSAAESENDAPKTMLFRIGVGMS